LLGVICWISRFKIDSSDLHYLAQLRGAADQPLFTTSFLDYLAQLRFTGHIDAVPEGSVVFPYEPLIRVQAPLIEAQLLESALLNLINFPTLIATKAARICIAAQGDPVLEFGLRRAQGIDGALTASRAAYIGGCASTSNTLAGKLFDIPVRGTHAHSWVLAFDSELEAFEQYAAALPDNALFLVDTYDTLQGVQQAIEIGHKLRANGHELLGVRLDSGDLAHLSIECRRLLDEAGFSSAVIVASNELDEIIITELKRQGARINVWGVGTHLVTSTNQPALDGVYKLSAIRDPDGEWEDKIKLSEQMVKTNHPGILQVRRYHNHAENTLDVIYDTRQTPFIHGVAVDPNDATHKSTIQSSWTYRDLLVPIFRNGELCYTSPPLKTIRATTLKELAQFPIGIKRFLNPHLYKVHMESSLYRKKIELVRKIRQTVAKDQHIRSINSDGSA
jgi:nicotinate phosphoribosyltransferase